MCLVNNKNVCVLKDRCLYSLIVNETSNIDIVSMDNNNRFGCYLLEEKEKTQLFKQAWNRLDTGMKLNRIRLFSEQKAKEKKFNRMYLL